MRSPTAITWRVCDSCGDRLGAYEALLVAHPNGVRERTGLLGLRDRILPPGTRVLHAACSGETALSH